MGILRILNLDVRGLVLGGCGIPLFHQMQLDLKT